MGPTLAKIGETGEFSARAYHCYPSASEALPQADEPCRIAAHSRWRGSLTDASQNDGHIAAWFAKRVPFGDTASSKAPTVQLNKSLEQPRA
jgi:hypothetical protein